MIKTLKKYRVESKAGIDYGIWFGTTPLRAWQAMIVAGGGPAVDADGKPVEGTFDDWIVTETTGDDR